MKQYEITVALLNVNALMYHLTGIVDYKLEALKALEHLKASKRRFKLIEGGYSYTTHKEGKKAA